jgi:hypothetical protein
MEEIDDFRAIAQFAETYTEELTSSDLDPVKKKFIEFAREYAEGWDDDADWLRQVASDLDGAELSDWQSGDFHIIREYMRPIPR